MMEGGTHFLGEMQCNDKGAWNVGFGRDKGKEAWFDIRNCGGKRGMLAAKEGEREDFRRYCGPKDCMCHARSLFQNLNLSFGRVGSILHNSWDPLSFFPHSRFFSFSPNPYFWPLGLLFPGAKFQNGFFFSFLYAIQDKHLSIKRLINIILVSYILV